MTKVKRSGALLVVLALALGAALAGTSTASTGRSSGTLKGAGSSFVAPLVAQWQANYKSSDVQYNPIGSGGGIAAITSRTVDFGASDAPLSKDQFSACKGCVQIPWALSATAIPYNIPGLNGRLHLNAGVLADIYLGKIKKWNDSRIKAINPGVNLPGEDITPIYRSDGSGTSYNFTDYLSHVSKEWKSKIGKGTQPSFPAGVGARGSSGVAAKLSSTPGGITYVDVAYSLKNKFKIAKLKNRAGKYQLPGLRQIQAAAASITKINTRDNAITVVDPNPRAPKAYPLCTFTWVIVPLKTSKAPELKKFVDWALTKGQSYGPKLLFVPLPITVKKLARKTVARVHT